MTMLLLCIVGAILAAALVQKVCCVAVQLCTFLWALLVSSTNASNLLPTLATCACPFHLCMRCAQRFASTV